jgi:hypothetical protein
MGAGERRAARLIGPAAVLAVAGVAASGGAHASGLPPDPPSPALPPHLAEDVPTEATLRAGVSDPDGDPLTVTFHGRKAAASAPDFTIVVLPDTQFYTIGFPATFTQQTQWIAATRAALDTVFVTHVGDIVQSLDENEQEWMNASQSLGLLDGVVPYGLAVGTHDMYLEGVASFFDQYFPPSRYSGQTWYGGHFRRNKNSYQLFSAGALDFVILHLEYDPTDAVLAWADGILKAFAGRRAVVTTHVYLDEAGVRRPMPWIRPDGNSAEEIFRRLVAPNCNVVMVLNGHYPGEARPMSTNDCGGTVHQVLMDYQNRPNGGDGWLRYFTFRPSAGRVEAYTYSPKLGRFENDADSRFDLDLPLGSPLFTTLAVLPDVPSGSEVEAPWGGRSPDTEYEWFVTVSDGTGAATGPIHRFTTQGACPAPASGDASCDGRDDDCDGAADEEASPQPTTCGWGACSGNAGWLRCEAGAPVDTCSPSTARRPTSTATESTTTATAPPTRAWSGRRRAGSGPAPGRG